MPRTHPLLNADKHCRICLIDYGCMISLQDEHVKTKLNNLSECTHIDIKYEEHLPSKLCHVCLYKINMWDEFKKRFIQSNKILMGQLEVSEVSDSALKDSSESNKPCLIKVTRKRLYRSCEDVFDNYMKKCKTDPESELPIVIDKVIHISNEDDNAETLSKDISYKEHNVPRSNKSKKDGENGSEELPQRKSPLMLTRARLLLGRRGRAHERRKASMKRWVERKKALFAARENATDTDSVGSDNTEMSPVRKARAKTNADKEAERQKRVAKVLKNLETNLSEKYTAIRDNDQIVVGDTDSDARRTRLNRISLLKQPSDKWSDIKRDRSSSQENSMEKENSPVVRNVAGRTKKSESQIDILIPHSMKSELVIGDNTYIVTLILSEPSRLELEANNLTKDHNNTNADESSPEKNTDIIDAVQLRRIRPTISNANSKKSVERCLNIEVEGTELEALKRVQVELADFVQKGMKHKLFSDDAVNTDKTGTKHRKLDEQLKNIIEKVIKNNVEYSLMRDAVDAKASVSGVERSMKLSSTFVKMAMESPKYQPKVMVKRLNIAKASKLYRITNLHVLKQTVRRGRLAGPFSAIYRKRQSVPPIKYNDYNTSALDSDSDKSDDVIEHQTSKVTRITNVRMQEDSARSAKQSSETNNSGAITIVRRMDGSIIKLMNGKIASASPAPIGQNSTATNKQKLDYEEIIKIEGAIAENHICGVCGISFNSRKDVETHVRTHKTIANSAEGNMTFVQRNQKPKVMRCKRCQEIVEACYVKRHVCKMLTHAHKCYVCNSTFRTEKFLMRHLESHDQSEFNIENVTKVESKKPSDVDASSQGKPEIEASSTLTEKNDIQSDKVTSTGVKLDSTDAVDKSNDTYTCFVCDKLFTDKEILKDHLQKHCDDLSEGEQSNSKEQYQCAICGDSVESDHALEEHVGKHLFDDEDDNPNLISIEEQEDKKSKNYGDKGDSDIYRCDQCTEAFASDVLLEMHMQAHEEDAAIAEWEKKELVISSYQCMLCGDHIDTEKELLEHLDAIHHIGNDTSTQVCQLCDMTFSTLEELQEHVAIH